MRSAASLSAAALQEWRDEDLLAAVHQGNDLAIAVLLTRYRSFARAKARSYFLAGGDREDIVQEGMIGLYKAVRDFNPAMEKSFRGFAEMCITRQVLSAVKGATRHKHGPLNSYVSLVAPVGDDGTERTLADTLPSSPLDDPAEVVISADRLRALRDHLDDVLSSLEVEVLALHLDGKSYVEMAEVLDRHVKSIDNALQRIKRKLDTHLRERAVAEHG